MTTLKECLEFREKPQFRACWENELLMTVFKSEKDGEVYCLNEIPRDGAEYVRILSLHRQHIFNKDAVLGRHGFIKNMPLLEHESDFPVFRPALIY